MYVYMYKRDAHGGDTIHVAPEGRSGGEQVS